LPVDRGIEVLERRIELPHLAVKKRELHGRELLVPLPRRRKRKPDDCRAPT
jgi:hypothetical protein